MTKHTPAPWGIVFGDVVPIVFSGKNGAMVASMGRLLDADEAMANARLIAAAPELLEALKTLCTLDSKDSSTEWNVAFNNGAAAIAKATGEQK